MDDDDDDDDDDDADAASSTQDAWQVKAASCLGRPLLLSRTPCWTCRNTRARRSGQLWGSSWEEPGSGWELVVAAPGHSPQGLQRCCWNRVGLGCSCAREVVQSLLKRKVVVY